MRNLIPILLALVVLSSGCDSTETSAETQFTNCGDLVSHEGYNYSTIQIGDQCWFSENCRYLPSVSPSSEGSETEPYSCRSMSREVSEEPYYYVYDYDGTDVAAAVSTSNYDTYGVLYNWPAVMTEGICPSGWHVPFVEEFDQLTSFLGGGGMKEAGYDHWNSPNTGATNSSGFNCLPGGYRFSGGFFDKGSNCYYWSKSETQGGAWARALNYKGGEVYTYGMKDGQRWRENTLLEAQLWHSTHDAERVRSNLNFGPIYNGIDIHLGFTARCVRD